MIRWLAAICLVLLATSARADQLRPAYLEFTQITATTWRLVWKIPFQGGITPRSQPVLPAGCAVMPLPQRQLTAVALITTTNVRCTGLFGNAQIGVTNIENATTDILVRVAPLGGPVQAARLTAKTPLVALARNPDRWQIARTYIGIGIEHIAFGYDHLLFVIALVLLLGRVRQLVWAVTSFTVAHSITLVGTTLGFLGLPSRPVEALIALSIVFLAVEIVKKVPDRPRLSERIPWAVAFGFGLLHGFGFAGALAEIGLPQTELPTALLSFNLGVEAGQLAIVVVTMAIVSAVRRFAATLHPPAIRVATYAIGISASFWLIERITG